MTDIDHTGRTNGRSKTGHHALQVNVKFLKANSQEYRVHQHLDMPADKNVGHDEDAVERTPLLLRNFNPLLHQVDQDVLEVGNTLLLFVFMLDVQTAVRDHLSYAINTFRKM
jgi:hypothetical protein